MSSASPFVTINKPGEDAISWVVQQLGRTGLRVIRTFDMRESWMDDPDCTYSHHGTEKCDCQVMVLLVYSQAKFPATIFVQSIQKFTWLYLVDTPEQPVNEDLERTIKTALTIPNSLLPEIGNNGDTHEFS